MSTAIVGIETRVQAESLRNHGSIPGRGKRFSFLHNVETVPAAHPALYTNQYLDLIGWSQKLTIHLHLVPRSRIVELYLHSPTFFMAWCLIN
jgi:hypothetical protein